MKNSVTITLLFVFGLWVSQAVSASLCLKLASFIDGHDHSQNEAYDRSHFDREHQDHHDAESKSAEECCADIFVNGGDDFTLGGRTFFFKLALAGQIVSSTVDTLHLADVSQLSRSFGILKAPLEVLQGDFYILYETYLS